jgi:hypothetical protein
MELVTDESLLTSRAAILCRLLLPDRNLPNRARALAPVARAAHGGDAVTYRDYLLDQLATIALVANQGIQVALRQHFEESQNQHMERTLASMPSLLQISPNPETVTGISWCECGDGGHDLGVGVCMCGGVIR